MLEAIYLEMFILLEKKYTPYTFGEILGKRNVFTELS